MNLKLHIFLTSLLVLTCVACSGSDNNSTPQPEVHTLNVTPTQLQATAPPATYTIAVDASRGEWTAYSDASWLSLTNTGTATAHGTITVKVAANEGTDARQTTITVKSGTARTTVAVTQAAPLLLSPARVNTGSKGETVQVKVVSTEKWTVSTADSWISVKPTADDAFSVTTAPNDAQASRTGTVTVKTASQELILQVYQESVADRTMTIPEGYRLVWHDEFDGNALSADWVQEAKPAGWVNNELQTYIKGSTVNEVANGKLNIHCYKGADGKIYSGRVYAKPDTGWTYGYFEARILLPKGKGTWPAFWMMPSNNNYQTNPWPGCGENDIMEEVGVNPNYVSSTIHCNKYNNGGTPIEHFEKYLPGAEGEFHVYACEWTEDYIAYFVDGVKTFTYQPSNKSKDYWPFNVPFYPILNLAWGGVWGGMKGVDETALPATMQVDYLRVFQK